MPHRQRRLAPVPGVGFVLVAVSLILSPAALGQTAQVLNTRSLAASCASCHGTDGQSAQGVAIPKLAGLSRDYFATQMLAFREGTRPATVMQQIAKGYSVDQIDVLATYFAAQK